MEEKIIILVQQYECLYNIQHKDYDNNSMKENIWKEIGNSLMMTSEECKSKWANLRAYYRKARNRRKTTSGEAAKKIKRWRYEDQMEFLTQYMQDRTAISSLESEMKDYVNPAIVYDETPVPSPSASTSSGYTSRKRKIVEEKDDPLATALTKFIESRQPVEKKLTDKSKLMVFFEDIAETMSSFAQLEQVELKSQIFNLVNKKQLECLRRSSTNVRGVENFNYTM